MIGKLNHNCDRFSFILLHLLMDLLGSLLLWRLRGQDRQHVSINCLVNWLHWQMVHVYKDNEVCFFLGEEKIGIKTTNKQTRKQVFQRDGSALIYTSNREVMIHTPFLTFSWWLNSVFTAFCAHVYHNPLYVFKWFPNFLFWDNMCP